MAFTVMAGEVLLACEAGPSRSAHVGPSSLLVMHACSLDQADGTCWFSAQSHSTNLSRDSLPNRSAKGSVEHRYAETLWLGELHTGLSQFLSYIARLTTSHELDEALVELCLLIKSSNTISKRHRSAALRVLPDSGGDASDAQLEQQKLSHYEIELVRRIVDRTRSGLDAGRLSNVDLGPLREQWTSCMESREIQLQILVTMCLLQIASQEPRALELARSRVAAGDTLHPSKEASKPNPVPDNENDAPRKRSRKLEKARRWRGAKPHSDSSDAFAWNRKVRRRMASDLSHEDGDVAEVGVLEVQGSDVLSVEHLSKRLEALVDILCLRQVAAGLTSQIGDLLSSNSTGDEGSCATRTGSVSLFGSSARKLLEDDDLDDAQWLCSNVVEPFFGASLPRQCSLFRSKCFVSLQSRTPARPAKTARQGSMGSTPRRVGKNSIAAASTRSTPPPPGGGLSHILEREQAGKRVKRNVLAERSSVLGRGREVDMGRRWSRSVSVTSAHGREGASQSSVFSRSGMSAGSSLFGNTLEESQGQSRSSLDRGNGRFASQTVDGPDKSQRSEVLPMPPSFAASSQAPAKRLLVLSTPQKEPAGRMLPAGHSSQLQAPRLVFPSLVMESPTQDTATLLGPAGRRAERCTSFGGVGSLRLKRTPSPVASRSDLDS